MTKRRTAPLRDLIDRLGPSMFVGLMTPQGILIEANRPALAAAGLKPEDVLGKPFEDAYWWSYSQPLQQQLREAIGRAARGEASRYDARVCVAEHQFIDVDFSLQPVLDENGEVVCIVPSAIVITERKRAEEGLRRSETLLRMAGRLSRVGAWSVDLPEFKLTLSDEACAIHDMSTEFAPTIEEALNFYAPECRATMTLAYEACVRDGTTFDVELQIITARGRRVWVRSIGEAERDGAGLIRRVGGAIQDITDRKQSEHALRESDEKFHQLADHITDAFWIRSPDMREVHYISPAFERIWGRSVESLYANPHQWADFILPEDRERVLSAFEALTRDAPSLDIEYRIVRPDGEIRWVRVRGFQIRDAADELIRHTGIVTDITEQKRAEVVLQESEGRYRAVVELSPESIAVSRGGKFLFLNPAAVRMMGATSERDLVGTSILDRVHPDSRQAVLERTKSQTDSDGVLPMLEERLITLDGAVIDVEHEGRTITYEGEPATLSYIRDVTESRRAAEALSTSLEEFRTLAEAMPQIVWITRADGWNVYFNQQWMDYTGLTLDESLGHGWNTPFHPDDRQRAQDAWRHATATIGTYSIESRLRRADGVYRWWLVRGAPLQDATGNILKWFGTCTDIHDLKLAELEISRINRALKMLSSCNEMLIRAEHEQDLLDQTCVIAVENGGYRMAWMGYTQDDESRSITPLAHAGVEEGYLSAIRVTWNENEPQGQGPAGEAIRTGQAVVCEDLMQAPGFAPWHALAQQRGYRGVICLPLRDATHTFGLLTLFSAAVNQTSAEELKLLQELADDVAFGIGSLRARSERRRLEVAVVKVAASVSAATGTAFFEQLARNMAEAVGADGAFVAQLLPEEPPAARTIAAIVDDRVADNFDYRLQGTPSDGLLMSDSCVIPTHVTDQFPHDLALAALGAQAYVGRRLNSSAGQPLGQLFVVFREPLKGIEFVTSTLQIFAARAASELERQQTDAQLREQAALLDIANEAILVSDLGGRILHWNKGAERTYGWSAAEVLGRVSGELVYGDSVSLHQAQATLLAQGEWHGELIGQTKDGRNITVEARWTLVRDAEGRPKSILAINTDITEKKTLESQFLRAQRMEGIGTLAGGIAHDLNNVLAPIVMSIEMLKELITDPEGLTLLATLQGSAQRGAALVKQVLSFARGVEGQRIVVNPLHVMRDLLEVMRDTFPKSIDVRITPARDLWTVTGDPTQMHQVFLNLCVNARDAMPLGGALAIGMENVVLDYSDTRTIPDSRPGAYVRVKVEDTGTGVPPEIMDRVFEPFFTTKGIGKGTGLGLSTTLAIVKSHGGFIHLQSAAGKGTTFGVYLPANTALAAVDKVAAEDPRLPRGNGELILVVDDEEGIRIVARRTLERFGYRVLVACDGAEAVSLYARHQGEIAAVLTDMSMPIMDGPALIRLLEAMNPQVRIIRSSGLMSAVEATNVVGAGVQHFIPKPYTASAILKILQGVLSGHVSGERQ